MAVDQNILNDLLPLSSKTFDQIREFHFKPDATMTGLKLLRDKARNEKNLRELYRGRAFYELLQNADDCGAKVAFFFLTPEGMAFGHDGQWFTVRNFINLADGWSDKDPKQCIGHKGLGFRSVLDITPSPHLTKVSDEEFLAIKFSWALNHNFIQSVIRENSKLNHEYQEWIRHGERICPVMYIPNNIKKTSLGHCSHILDHILTGKYDHTFTTLFWFPSKDSSISSSVLNEIDPATIISDIEGRSKLTRFMKEEVTTILPFLRSIKNVTLIDRNETLSHIDLDCRIKDNDEGVVQLSATIEGQAKKTEFRQLRRTLRIPLEVKQAQGTPKAVKRLDEVGLTIAVEIKQGKPIPKNDARFHVYFPTNEKVGLGFVVHSDFYVAPDRTRLMEGKYNEWLLDQASEVAANEFLSMLLKEYRASDVFASIIPPGQSTSNNGFVSRFASHLKKRKRPFVPVSSGLTTRDKIVIPPRLDPKGFWQSHFSAESHVEGEAREFLKPSEDTQSTRAFLTLASIPFLQPSQLLDYIERFGKGKSPQWWSECLSHLANDPYFAPKESSDFQGRKLVMLHDREITACPVRGGKIICLPPTEKSIQPKVPSLFSKHLDFVHPELAGLISSAREHVKDWIKRCLGISVFEASDLLPRVSAKVAVEAFAMPESITFDELAEIWGFMVSLVESASRKQLQAERFWENIGRLPVVLENSEEHLNISPAFLTYFPDKFLPESSPIRGVGALRWISEDFLKAVATKGSTSLESCSAFFAQAGVSNQLKARQFRYVVGSGDPHVQIQESFDGEKEFSFTGERQRDENRLALNVLRRHGIWTHFVGQLRLCSHGSPKVVRNLTLLEGFEDCAVEAMRLGTDAQVTWQTRLLELAGQIATIVKGLGPSEGTASCRGGGGHDIALPSLIQLQIKRIPWLPTTLGAAKIEDSFSRLRSRRLISVGVGNREHGDSILPYVVLGHVEKQLELQSLGLRPLEDAENADTDDLIRALRLIGAKLSSQWGEESIVQNKPAWRLVRGAIQEIYRVLNQRTFDVPNGQAIPLACRKPTRTIFESGEIFFAEPGSDLERAFSHELNLLDADRPYVSFFTQIGITRLLIGTTVRESIRYEGNLIEGDQLRESIIQNLAPYLLALIFAKSEKPKHAELVTRRLLERFSVKVVEGLSVIYRLDNSAIEQTVIVPRFYLQTETKPGAGAIEEKVFSLHVVGNETISLFDLDADDLGQHLVPVFIEDNEQLAAAFPRVTGRYRQAKGNSTEMEEFMLHQLGVSAESLDYARALIAGEALNENFETPAVPGTTWVSSPISGLDPEESRKKLVEILDEQKKQMLEEIQKVLDNTVEANKPGSTQNDETKSGAGGVTPKQEERGTKGEEEIKRRIVSIQNGWEGFTLIKDRRKDNCGYDFLCVFNGTEVQVEVKTFAPNGRIIFDQRELKTASSSGDRYFLIGVLDSGDSPTNWKTFTIRNPFELLFTKGRFLTDIKLEVSPSEIFVADRHDQRVETDS